MSILGKPPRYRSYLLACWEERSRGPDGPVVWRFSLEDPRTGQRRAFADPEALAAFLRTEFSGDKDEPSEESY